MKIADMNLNLNSIHEPKSRQDLILLLDMACAEFEYINAYLAKITEAAKTALEA